MTAVPAGTKKPADRKTPAPKPVDGVMTATVDGHEYQVPEDALDDFELLDDLNELQRGDGTRLPAVLKRLLGKDGFRAAMDNLRDPETGRVGAEVGAEFVMKIFEVLNPNS